MNLFKSFSILILFSIVIFSFSAFMPLNQKELLNFKITNIKKNSGKVVVEIYNTKSSWLKIPFRTATLSANQNCEIALFQVPYGRYAVTVYQDSNNNGEADMNFLGIPKELVGFGNNYKPFGEPKFKSALINFSALSKTDEIKLYKVL